MIARFLTLLDMPAKHSVTLNLSGGIRRIFFLSSLGQR